MPKRRNRPATDSTRCTTRCIEPTCCGTPTGSASVTTDQILSPSGAEISGEAGAPASVTTDQILNEYLSKDWSASTRSKNQAIEIIFNKTS